MYKLKGGLLYNTDCFSYWQGKIQASYAVMRQLLYISTGHIGRIVNKQGIVTKYLAQAIATVAANQGLAG